MSKSSLAFIFLCGKVSLGAIGLVGLWALFGQDWPAVGIVLGVLAFLVLCLWNMELEKSIEDVSAENSHLRMRISALEGEARTRGRFEESCG